MSDEQEKMARAKRLFREFEALSETPEAFNPLTEGIGLLRAIYESSTSEQTRGICSVIFSTYKNNVLETISKWIEDGSKVDEKRLNHWIKIMEAFEDTGFELGEEFSATKDLLRSTLARHLLLKLPVEQRKELLRKFEAEEE